ncbi:MAG: hypothetical protein D6726_03395 [Nitrospirae bacterium]|nr:MAG: hypothetical protein D6726_03395 [Nitrospirota bacterium]
MNERRRFQIFLFLSALLIILVISYNIFHDYFEKNIFSYIQRRIYYERVISKSGLSKEKARFWRRIEK